jgi:hypothetical protein
MGNPIMRKGTAIFRVALVLAAVFTWPARSEAGIVNGGFETGTFSGYTTTGSAIITTAVFGTGPVEGTYQAFLSNGSGAVDTGLLESFLGEPSGSLNALGNGQVFNGSALAQTFSATAGSLFSFQWNFLTNEDLPSLFNDHFAFVRVVSLNTLVDTNFPIFIGSNTSFISETGFQTFTMTLPTTGDYQFAVGVVNVGDTLGESGLLVDNLLLGAAVPEPTSFFLLFAGCSGLAVLKRWERTSS